MPRAHGCARAANHLGQRISKTVAGVKTYFVYSDIDGQMLGEYTATGTPIREYIYLEGERVAMYDYTGVEPKDSSGNKAIVYFHNDQVGQVQFAFNSDGQMIYERIQTPFGETMSEMNAYNVQVPVRFPGQYYDSESGFSQNWHRDYDPALGRYVQSDPVGILKDFNHNPEFEVVEKLGISVHPTRYGSGLNHMYGYVEQNPIMHIDLLGLALGENGCGLAEWLEGWSGCNPPKPPPPPVEPPPQEGGCGEQVEMPPGSGRFCTYRLVPGGGPVCKLVCPPETKNCPINEF